LAVGISEARQRNFRSINVDNPVFRDTVSQIRGRLLKKLCFGEKRIGKPANEIEERIVPLIIRRTRGIFNTREHSCPTQSAHEHAEQQKGESGAVGRLVRGGVAIVGITSAHLNGALVRHFGGQFKEFTFAIYPAAVSVHPTIPRHDRLVEAVVEEIVQTAADEAANFNSGHGGFFGHGDADGGTVSDGYSTLVHTFVVATVREVHWSFVDMLEGGPDRFVELGHA